MILLLVSQLFVADHALAYGLLLAATASLGAGFGLTTPAINTLTGAFHPRSVDTWVLTLNALLGLGTALAPVFVAPFVGLGFWWGLPIMSAVLIAVLIVVSAPLPLRANVSANSRPAQRGSGVPARFWLFAAFAVLYGICETMNGNWAEVDMTQHLGASATQASLALTAFWGMVTVGRVVFALLQRWLPTWRAYHVLPFALSVVFVLIAVLPHGSPWLGVLAFGAAGLACSALLPLTISFGQGQLAVMSASIAGGVIAFYQLGYGIAAFGAGPLQNAGLPLPVIFGASAGAGLVLGGLAFAVGRRHPVPGHLHPRP